MGNWILPMLLVVSLVLYGCCGAVGGAASKSSSQSAIATPPSEPTKQVSGENPSSDSQTKESSKNIESGESGTTYLVNYLGSKYEITLQKAEFAESQNAYFYGYYLMAYFEIKNAGSSSEYLAPDIYAVDKEGEKYDGTIAFGMSDKYSKTLDFIKKLTPGTKTSGWVAIEVPDGTNDIDLYFEYTNSFISSEPNYIKYRISS